MAASDVTSLLVEALERLAALDPRQATLVELRFFGGFSVDEAAEAMREMRDDSCIHRPRALWTPFAVTSFTARGRLANGQPTSSSISGDARLQASSNMGS